MPMKNFIIFDNPAVAAEMRKAGFIVFKQQFNGKECFAAENTAELAACLPTLKERFNVQEFAIARTLHF